MTESVVPRDVEQPRDEKSSAGGPPSGATERGGSLFPAVGFRGCSTGDVAPRPATPTRQLHLKTKRSAREMEEVASRRSALETTDALPKNCSFGGNKLLFFLDRLFHRRFYKVLLFSPHLILPILWKGLSLSIECPIEFLLRVSAWKIVPCNLDGKLDVTSGEIGLLLGDLFV